MTGNAKTSIYITAVQLNWLQTKAAKLGLSINELLRRLIDEARRSSGN